LKYEGIAEKLYDADNIEQKFQVLENITINAGFDAVLYTFMPKLMLLTESIKPVFQYSEKYRPIVENYLEHDFRHQDFTIRLAESGYMDIIDWWKVAGTIKLTNEEKNFNHIIKEKFGVTKGISFPALSSDVGIAGASIIQLNREVKPVDEKLLQYLKKCFKIYHHHMIVHQDDRYRFILPLLESLTPRKKAVIRHLISGQPMKNIVEQGISERYGEKLLSELRKSFGSISKNELIYLLGLLNISEYL